MFVGLALALGEKKGHKSGFCFPLMATLAKVTNPLNDRIKMFFF
jgi:hypothetical protein